MNETISRETRRKEEALMARLRSLRSVAVAFSGGVDSTYLLAAARDALGAAGVLALTADTALIPRHEIAAAKETAARLGVRHQIVELDPFENAGVVANQPDRCYHCKRIVFGRLTQEARQAGFQVLAHGANVDDRGDYRPGQRAAEELGVVAPLDEAGLTKDEIRALSRRRGLPTWDMPAQACLASRIPYHVGLTRQALAQVEQTEGFLRRRFGLRALRVRHHGAVARLELPSEDWPALLEPAARQEILAAFRQAGFGAVALDLAGLQSGSMNRLLERMERMERGDEPED